MIETRHRTVPLLVVMCLGHILLISAQVQSRDGVSLVEAGGFGAFAWIQQATAAVSDAGRNVWSHYFALSGAAKENDDLKRRLLEVQGDLQLAQARARRTGVLEEALGLRRALPLQTLAAEVLAGSPDASMDIVVGRGTRDGVERDMAVIAADGVVGRVVQAGRDSSRVQLLVNSNAAASARLEGSEAGGVVEGQDNELLEMNFVSSFFEVEPGEQVMTSGQDGIYPQGLVIGTVETSEPGGDYRTIMVRPAVDFSLIDTVLIILSKPNGQPGTP